MDGVHLTNVRTAAASAVATQALARPESTQARPHRRRRPGRRAPRRRWRRCCRSSTSPVAARTPRLRGAVRRRAGQPVTRTSRSSAVDPPTALAGADVVCTVSSAREPVVTPGLAGAGRARERGRLACARDPRDRRRGDARRRVVVDSREATLDECGDCLLPIAEGSSAPSTSRTSSARCSPGREPGRQAADEITSLPVLRASRCRTSPPPRIVYDRAPVERLGLERPHVDRPRPRCATFPRPLAAASRRRRVRARHAVRPRVRRRGPDADRRSSSPAAACEAIEPLFAEPARQPRLASGALPAGRARERHGRRDRPVAPLPRRRPVALPVQPRRAAGSMTPVHDHLAWGLIGLYRGNQDEEFYRPGDGRPRARPPAAARARRPLPAAPAARRRPPGPDDLRRDLRLDPSARERHRLHPPPHLRRGTPASARPFRSGYVNAECEEPVLTPATQDCD